MTRLWELQDLVQHGEALDQAQLDRVIQELTPQKSSIRPKDKDEPLPLITSAGEATGAEAPRWICHALGLRHRCAHVLLIWRSGTMGDVLILQIRSWSKDDSPGKLDITVGGHMTAIEKDVEKAALTEMLQEVGLDLDDLVDRKLHLVDGYPFDEEPRPAENFFNSEWRDVFIGFVRDESFGKIHFPDGEVAGVALFPSTEAAGLLRQEQVITKVVLQVASALKHSLPRCLEYLNQGKQLAAGDADEPRG